MRVGGSLPPIDPRIVALRIVHAASGHRPAKGRWIIPNKQPKFVSPEFGMDPNTIRRHKDGKTLSPEEMAAHFAELEARPFNALITELGNLYRALTTWPDASRNRKWTALEATELMRARGRALTSLLKTSLPFRDRLIELIHTVDLAMDREVRESIRTELHAAMCALQDIAESTEGVAEQVRFDTNNHTVTLDGETYPLTEDQFYFVKAVFEACGGWVPTKNIPGISARGDHLVKRLPQPIRKHVESKKGAAG